MYARQKYCRHTPAVKVRQWFVEDPPGRNAFFFLTLPAKGCLSRHSLFGEGERSERKKNVGGATWGRIAIGGAQGISQGEYPRRQ